MNRGDPGREHRSGARRAALRATATLVLGIAALDAHQALAAVSCSTSAPTLAFGNYDPSLATPTDITSGMTVTCTRAILDPWSVAYTISLSTGGSGSYAARRMNAGTSLLNYNVYTNASRSQVWGDGTGSTGIVGATINFNLFQFSKSAMHTAYGRIPAGQNASAGSYNDNLVVTLTF